MKWSIKKKANPLAQHIFTLLELTEDLSTESEKKIGKNSNGNA